MRSILLFLWGMCYMLPYAVGQDPELNLHVSSEKHKSFFLTWGYNRAYYNKSDIHFKGEGYDFTLFDVRAEDMPEEFEPDVYFNPSQFTVPQFNFRLGYYFSPNTAVSLGWDHMKYHIVPTQLVRIGGYIDEAYGIPEYTGTFDNDYILYKPSFMNYHHSDGFNFIRLAIERRIPIWNIDKKSNHIIAMNASVSVGAMMPWTDFTFFGVNHRNKPHFAGYGASIHAGFRYEFYRYFFIQCAAQAGWSNLPDVMLEDHLPSRASQKIVFLERSWAVGGYIPLARK